MAMENIVDEVPDAQKAERAGGAGFLWDFWYPAARSAEIRGRGWRRRCCWKCRWFWGGRMMARRLLCGMLVRTGGYRFPRGGLTGRAWNAVITDGSSMGAAGSVWRFLR